MRNAAGSFADGEGGRAEEEVNGVPGTAMLPVLLRCADNVLDAKCAAYISFRRSLLGRNLSGVWNTLGAEDGGL